MHERRLRGVVVSALTARHRQTRLGSNIDDRATAYRSHRSEYRLRAEKHPTDIDAEHLIPFLDRNIGEWAPEPDPGVVDQRVDAAVDRYDMREQSVDVVRDRYVGLLVLDTRIFRCGLLEINRDHCRPVVREAARNRGANTPSAPGDNHHTVTGH